MAAKLTKTTSPGIYRRHKDGCPEGKCSCPYVAIWRGLHGQEKHSFPTFEKARDGKALGMRRVKLAKVHARGFHAVTPEPDCPVCQEALDRQTREQPLLHEYARDWIERYRGTGKRGYREETRIEARRVFEKFTLAYFPAETRLVDIGPQQIDQFVSWLAKQPSTRGGTLSESSIRNVLGPLSSCLATARREGLIQHNPAVGATLPHEDRIEEDEEKARPFPGDTMEIVVSLIHPKHRVMYELLAATGVRRSELLALEVRHLALDGACPHVKIRQRARRRRGTGMLIGPLKSRHSRRDLPIPIELADKLGNHVAGRGPNDLVFVSAAGTILEPDNLHSRVLAPACGEAGVEWAGHHTFRHTVASRLFAQGRNAVQVQRWLGHYSPVITMNVYVHLLDDDIGGPLESKQTANHYPGVPTTPEVGIPLDAAILGLDASD